VSTLGDRLRHAREAKGWSQLYVAKRTGNFNISKYERGSRQPDADTLGMLAKLYEVSLDYLLDDEKTTIDTEGAPLEGHPESLETRIARLVQKLDPDSQRIVLELIMKLAVSTPNNMDGAVSMSEQDSETRKRSDR
jgi:transcriptional regulator with XRE-family HTH domain